MGALNCKEAMALLTSASMAGGLMLALEAWRQWLAAATTILRSIGPNSEVASNSRFNASLNCDANS
jgi:hypothetical protein